MEPAQSALSTLLSNVSTIITNFLTWFGDVCTSLIANDLVILMFGMGIALLIYKIVIGLVKNASFRRKGRRK